MRRIRSLALVVATLASATLGCGATAYNVRAYRAYSYEEPKLDVAVDRTADLARISELMNRILMETPYTPGAEWVARLPLNENEANRIRAELKSAKPYKDSSHQVPLIKHYRVHLEEVMAKAPAPTNAQAPAGAGVVGQVGREEGIDRSAGGPENRRGCAGRGGGSAAARG